MTSPSLSLNAKRMTTRHLRPASGGWHHVTSAQTPNEHVPVTFALITANDQNRCSVKPNYDWLDPLNGVRRQPTTRFSHNPKKKEYIYIDIFLIWNEISTKASCKRTYATFTPTKWLRITLSKCERVFHLSSKTDLRKRDRLRDPCLSFGHRDGSQLSGKLVKHASLAPFELQRKHATPR